MVAQDKVAQDKGGHTVLGMPARSPELAYCSYAL